MSNIQHLVFFYLLFSVAHKKLGSYLQYIINSLLERYNKLFVLDEGYWIVFKLKHSSV